MTELPHPKPGEAIGEIVVIRTKNVVAVTNSYLITIDGHAAWGIRNGEYTRLTLGEGPHRIGVECFGGWIPVWRESDAINIHVLANKAAYLLVGPDLDCASIESISDSDGQFRVQDSRLSP